MQSPVLATVELSVRLSVCLSVCPSDTRWHCVKMTQASITKSSPTDSPGTLVLILKSLSGNSTGFTLSDGANWEWGRKHLQFSANKSPYLRNGARYDQIYYWWLIGSCIRPFDCSQNQRPRMTLNGHYALYCTKHACFGAHHENLNEYTCRPTVSPTQNYCIVSSVAIRRPGRF